MNFLFNAYLDDFNKITILLPKHYFQGVSRYFTLINNNDEIELIVEQIIDIGEYNKYICLLPTFLELGLLYFVEDEYGNRTVLQSGAIVRNERFDTLYYYDKNDLGCSYTPDNSIFKLWAPTATKVSLYLKNNDDEQIIPMKRGKNGIYYIQVEGNLDGYLYRYLVTNNNREQAVIDIYGISSNANNEYSAVINPNKIIESVPLSNPIESPTDAIIYEVSIRDFTVSNNSGIKEKGKYIGLTERYTKSPNSHPTGLDYLINLGVTHVQFMPFFDFGGVDELEPNKMYNWGYNPEQYNAPEGSFSLVPNDPYSRINELKRLINTLHEQNIGVIMDVVYNHVHNINTFPFDYLVPGYFYRYDQYGMPSNGSGCGNDIASEREMVRKFIIDSVLFWAKTYKIDGFRFDLMGALDIETMNQIRKKLSEINPHILIYGEGWNLHTPINDKIKATISNAYKLPGIAFFNDKYRDFIKGHTFDHNNLGFAFGNFSNMEDIKQLVSGSIGYGKQKRYLFFEPYQTINYIECHDNMTIYDKVKIALSGESKEKRIRKQRLATSILLLSQGIPFIHSGQEFYRTKYGIENSYNLPDKINQIDWKRMDENYLDIIYIQELIKVRRKITVFRFNSQAKIKKHLEINELEKGILLLKFKDITTFSHFSEIQVIVNCTSSDFVYKFTDEFKLIFNEKAYITGKDIPNYYIVKESDLIIIGK